MRVLNVADTVGLDIGEKIPSLKGKVKRIFDQISGTNKVGPYTIQNLVLQDLNDPKSEIKIKIFDQDKLPPSYEGKTLYIQSNESDKGISGVEVAKDTYKWKDGDPIRKLIEVRKQAHVSLNDAQAAATQPPPKAATPPPADSKTTNQPPASTAGHTPQGQTKTQDSGRTTTTTVQAPPEKTKEQQDAEEVAKFKKNVLEARRAIGRSLNAFRLIMQGVDALQKQRTEGGKAMTPEQFHGTCTTIYIQLQRQGQVDALPYEDLENYLSTKKNGTSQG